MPPKPENPKTDEVGTTDGEAVQVAESVPETAPSSAEGYGMARQNEPKTGQTPSCESGQMGVIDPIASMETSTGEGVASEPTSVKRQLAFGVRRSEPARPPVRRAGRNDAEAPSFAKATAGQTVFRITTTTVQKRFARARAVSAQQKKSV